MIKIQKYSFQKAGFTLAETLITLVVIGVVAALTIPNLIVNHQKEETVTRLKKTYSALSQITNRAITDNGPIKSWEVVNDESKEFVDKYMAPYLNVAKNCGYSNTGMCRFQMRQAGNHNVVTTFPNRYYVKLILADGVALIIRVSKTTVNYNNQEIPRSSASVFVDINGQKGPNILGKDIFYYIYWIQNDWSNVGYTDSSGTFIPSGGGLGEFTREELLDSCKTGTGYACTTVIMIDSWQIKDDYPW